MENQTISRDNLKKIYDIACNTWKSKIEDYAKRNPFNNEITFTKNEINEMFKASDSNQLKILKEYFKLPVSVIDKVNSFEDACVLLNLLPEKVFTIYDTKDEIAFKKLKVIIKALNDGWMPDWNNSNQYKYWNYFRMAGGFSYNATYYHITLTNVPSALVFKDEALAKHAIKIALSEYKDYY